MNKKEKKHADKIPEIDKLSTQTTTHTCGTTKPSIERQEMVMA